MLIKPSRKMPARFNVVSDERTWDSVSVNLTLFEQQVLNIAHAKFSKNVINTGVKFDNTVSESFTITSDGFVALNNMNFELRRGDGSPLGTADNWISLVNTQSIPELAVGDSTQVELNFYPGSNVTPGQHHYTVRVTSDNYDTVDFPVYVMVTDSQTGGVLFKVTDMYTNEPDGNGGIIEGVEQAEVFMQYTVDPTQSFIVKTDNTGEVLVKDLSVGKWNVRINKAEHETYTATVDIKACVTDFQYVALKDTLVTVTWSVEPVTIVDRYDIVLNTTFKTNVPAAVVVAEPPVLLIPTLPPGSIYVGEIILTNQGLITAENVEFSMPPDTDRFEFQLFSTIPDKLAAKNFVRIKYSVKALEQDDDDDDDDTDDLNDCFRYVDQMVTKYRYVCKNEKKYEDTVSVPVSAAAGECETLSEPSSGGTSSSSGGSSGSGGGSYGGGGFGGFGGFTGGSSTGTTTVGGDEDCLDIEWSGGGGGGLNTRADASPVGGKNQLVLRAETDPAFRGDEIEYVIEEWEPTEEGGGAPGIVVVPSGGTIPNGGGVNNSDFPALVITAGSSAGRLTVNATAGEDEAGPQTINIGTDCHDCDTCQEPNSTNASLSSAQIDMSLGGEFGILTYKVNTPEAGMYTPKSLLMPSRSDEVKYVKDDSGYFRQIITPENFIDIVTVNDSTFEVRFYDETLAGDTDPKDGPFGPPGQMISKTVFSNPGGADSNQIKVIKEVQAQQTRA